MKIGQNENISSPENAFAWYQFRPEDEGIYKFSPINEIEIYTQYYNSLIEVDATDTANEFRLETQTYYVGLKGKINNAEDTGSFALGVEYTCKWEETKHIEPTCTTYGEIENICTVHGESRKNKLQPLWHDWVDEWKVTKLPTCTEEGEQVVTCIRCNELVISKIDKLGHIWGDWKLIRMMTCTEDGECERYCTREGCGEKETEITETWGHDWSEWKITSCTEDGYKKRYCYRCEEIESLRIPAPGHDWGEWLTDKDATCTKEGVRYRYCRNCGEKEDKIIEALGHTWYIWINQEPASCTEDGLAYRFCENCGEKEYQIIKALGHNMSWITVKEATCTEDGKREYYCMNYGQGGYKACNEKKIEIVKATGHNWSLEEITPATCTEPGTETRRCYNCNEEETRSIEALGHNWGEWMITRSARCGKEDGERERWCMNGCQKYETEVIKAPDHEWSNWAVADEVSCTEQGMEIKTCLKCGEEEERYVAALGHELGDWKVVSAASCGKKGKEQKSCSRCKYTETRESPALGHDMTDWAVTKVATCTENGEKERHCKRDGCEEKETKVIKALEHIWSEWKETSATCEQDGFRTRFCVRCNKQEHEILPATGHAWGEIKQNESTETENGKEYQICETCQAENVTKVLPLKTTAKTIERTKQTLAEITENTGDQEKVQKINSAVEDITKVENNELIKDDSAMDMISQIEEKVIENTVIANTVVNNENSVGIKVNDEVRGAALTAAVNQNEASEEVESIATKISVRDASEANQNSYKEQYGENTIAVDITMSVVDAKTENAISAATENIQPAAPIQMQMKLPELYADQKVELLHNHKGEVEKLPYTRNGLVVTFTMTALSDVIVQPVCETHQFNDGEITTEASCTSLGVLTKTCTICKSIRTESIRPTEHNYLKDKEASREATCTEKGVVVNKCSFCEDTDRTETPALDHEWSDWKTEKEATCTEDGNEERHCIRGGCKEKEEKTVKALTHDMTEWAVAREATCTQNGEKERHCKRDGCEEKKTEVLKATGHSMGNWKVAKEATAVAAGVKERICKVCGEKETAAIAKLKGTVTLNVAVNKTLPLKMKQTFQAKASGFAKGDKVVSWTSSNKAVATVSGNGKITAKKKAGSAQITVKLASGTTAKFTVKVQKTDVATTSITVLNKATGKKMAKTFSLKLKKKLTLTATVAPVTSKQKVTYSSSNKKIATVNSKGVITAKKKGTATITVKSGKKTVKIKIKVK